MLSALNNGVFEPIKINPEGPLAPGDRHRGLRPVINQEQTKLVSWDYTGDRTLKGGKVYEKIAINLIKFDAADLASMETTFIESTSVVSTPAFMCDKNLADYYTSEGKPVEHVAYQNGFTKFTDFDDLPSRLQPCANDITIQRYYRKWLSERSKAKYQVLPTAPSKLNFATKDSDFVKHQLKTNGVLSYLFFDNGAVTHDALPPDGRFDFDLNEATEFRGNSLGKSVVSYLVGHAQCNGHIAAVNEDLSSWPLVKNTAYEKAKLIDLLDMRAKDQHLINQKDHFVKNGRWTNSLSVGVAVEKVLRGTKPDRTAEYNQNSFAANLAMNYLIFKLGNNWQPFLNDVFQERVRIQSRIFFQKNGGLDESYGLGTYSMYATRYDYLRIAIAMIEDWQNGTCVGEYLKELVTRKQPKGIENWNDSDPKQMKNSFSFAADYAGNFHQSYVGLEKRNILGLEGYGGQSILIDLDNARAVVVNAASANYDWYELVYLPIRDGVVRQN